MKAVAIFEHGGADKLRYTDLPDPVPGAGEAVVEVAACALNHLDIWVRQGLPGVAIPLPHVLGCESVGTVTRLGPGVTGVQVGAHVLVSPGWSCGDCAACLDGQDSLCPSFRIMGYQVDGGYAELVKAPVRSLLPISTVWSDAEWAAFPLVFLTAWHMLVTRARLQAGETVLVHAAGSGIGTAAIQLGRLLGARVLTTAGSDDKVRRARELGADEGINYRARDFVDEVKRLTNKRGVDVVFEHIGPDTWEKSLACLGRGGRLVTCGATSGPTVSMDLRFLFVKQLSILGSYMGSRGELLKVLQLAQERRLRPVVDTVFPLREAAAAHARMEQRNVFGKLVLAVRG